MNFFFARDYHIDHIVYSSFKSVDQWWKTVTKWFLFFPLWNEIKIQLNEHLMSAWSFFFRFWNKSILMHSSIHIPLLNPRKWNEKNSFEQANFACLENTKPRKLIKIVVCMFLFFFFFEFHIGSKFLCTTSALLSIKY